MVGPNKKRKLLMIMRTRFLRFMTKICIPQISSFVRGSKSWGRRLPGCFCGAYRKWKYKKSTHPQDYNQWYTPKEKQSLQGSPRPASYVSTVCSCPAITGLQIDTHLILANNYVIHKVDAQRYTMDGLLQQVAVTTYSTTSPQINRLITIYKLTFN